MPGGAQPGATPETVYLDTVIYVVEMKGVREAAARVMESITKLEPIATEPPMLFNVLAALERLVN